MITFKSKHVAGGSARFTDKYRAVFDGVSILLVKTVRSYVVI
jgi:hypothetical protein